MADFKNEWYEKGYNDGVSDALNNIQLDDILFTIGNLSDDERQKLIETIEDYK